MSDSLEGRVIRVELKIEQHDERFQIVNAKIDGQAAGIPAKWKVDLSWALWIGFLVSGSGLLGAFIYEALSLD
jgi:hypothetical protein